jgi:uncharacterized membrane protein YkoI
MKSTIALPALLVAASIATAGGLALAKTADGENDAIADLAKATITLTQAVSAAETQAGGKATKAELEVERGMAVFEVEIVTPDRKVFDVQVDAADGKVLSSKLDQADHGEEDDD